MLKRNIDERVRFSVHLKKIKKIGFVCTENATLQFRLGFRQFTIALITTDQTYGFCKCQIIDPRGWFVPKKTRVEIELECTVSGPEGPGLDAFIDEVLNAVASSLDISIDILREPIPETGKPSA